MRSDSMLVGAYNSIQLDAGWCLQFDPIRTPPSSVLRYTTVEVDPLRKNEIKFSTEYNNFDITPPPSGFIPYPARCRRSYCTIL